MDKESISHHFSKLISELESQIAGKVLSLLLENSKTLVGASTINEKFLKDFELCELLQISISHMYKIKKNNEDFPFYNIGGAIRYKLSEVELFFKNY